MLILFYKVVIYNLNKSTEIQKYRILYIFFYTIFYVTLYSFINKNSYYLI